MSQTLQKKIVPQPLETKHRDCSLKIKSIDGEGRFAGYASVFDVVDTQRDLIEYGAFAKTIKGRTQEIRLLWQHNPAEPIGYFTTIFEDGRGLYVEGRLLLDIARAREAYSLLKVSAIGGLSIGYTPRDFVIDPDTGVRRLNRVDLWEISLVTFPANSSANVTVVKQYAGIEQIAPDDFVAPEWQDAQRNGQLIAFSDTVDRAIQILRH